ncbi:MULTISPECIES: glycosyltransferase family 39 protein [unclassified Wenzhouxiangella]|uniref:ArnT family glycosyltransferase n=1 Tax=unclassified Wenzhouxiangella TaxID=2613841 RepID=UPI0015F28854|nr:MULTISPECIES: glycosyltransferase family 39 protein [unclassified Wenzhouxiangella]
MAYDRTTVRGPDRSNLLGQARWERSISIGLGLLVLSLLVYMLFVIAGTPVSFDGAMNLQVAAALADGQGYGRFYDEWRLFPREIQTNAPYIFPAALVFAVFGVSLATAQIVSLAYLAGLVGIVYLLGRRLAGRVPALVACLLVLLVPELARLGANGYGEVPALFWAFAGLWSLHAAIDKGGGWRYFGAGLCFGLSILTKTVMLMPVGVVLGLFGLAFLFTDRVWRNPAAVGAGLLVPVAGWEAWKLWSFGGVAPWREWWQVQLDGILAQAGVSEGFQDSPGMLDKLGTHAEVLTGSLGLPVWLLPVLLALPCGLVFVAVLRTREEGVWSGNALLPLMLAACIVAYFGWWLLVTPTEKAWYRRIFNGVLLVALSAPLLPALAGRIRGRVGLSAISVVTVTLLVIGSLARFPSIEPSQADVRKHSTRAVVKFMKNAPETAKFYGYRWYSQPVFALYSGRRVHDLDKRKYWIDAEDGPHYFLVDGYMNSAGVVDKALRGLPHEEVLTDSDWGRVLVLRGAFELPPLARENVWARSEVRFREHAYDAVHGMFSPEGDGWRWAQPLSAVLLQHNGGDVLAVHGALPANGDFRFAGRGSTFGMQARVADCDLEWQYPDGSGRFEIEWSLAGCQLPPQGDAVTVELRTNAILKGTDRPLSWVAHEIRLKRL